VKLIQVRIVCCQNLEHETSYFSFVLNFYKKEMAASASESNPIIADVQRFSSQFAGAPLQLQIKRSK
jgi:hypothetical protein